MTKKIFIDAGHGGADGGASKYVKESEVNIKVVKYMAEYLKNNYICDVKKDTTDASTTTIAKRANNYGADLFVSVHFNAGGGDGYEALVYDKKNLALGECFEKQVKKIGQNSRGVKYRDDLIVLNSTNMKAILNECAFVDNKKDIEDWNENDELQDMGEALAKAAADWLDLPKKAKAKTLKVGAKVKIKTGAKDLNTKTKYKAWVYTTTYTVISISGTRVVFGKNGVATGATNKSNIKLV